jgi:putative membrane protein
MLWAFFFGLIIASALVVSKKISRWRPPVIASGLLGALFGYMITVIAPAETSTALWTVFLSGMIAICAMILPGISGSFILVLLGKYEYVLSALKDLHLLVIITFSSGCAIGIIAFSHLLNWALRKYYDITIAALTGIMIGSLNKVWPWKKVLETYTTHKGEIKPLVEQNVLPAGSYLEMTGREPYLLYAVILAIIGFAVVYYLEKIYGERSES